MKKLSDSLFISWTFARRDIKTRYAGSLLGTTWIVLYPLIMAIITSVVFSIVFKGYVDGVSFFLYSLSGFSFWIFFSQSITAASRCLIQNRDIIINNKISTELIVFGVIISRSLDLIVTTIFLVAAALYLHEFVFLPGYFILSVAALYLIVLALSLLVAAGNVFFRDIQAVTDILVNILFYLTPIVYPLSVIPSKFRSYLLINPLTQIVSSLRSSIIPVTTDHLNLIPLILIETLALILIYLLYKKLENKFAQVL